MNQIADTAKIYKDVRIVNSIIGDNCSVGDSCDLVDVYMENHIELGRRNYLRNVQIGEGTVTFSNIVLKHCTIGRYCSIASNIIGNRGHDLNLVSTMGCYAYKMNFGQITPPY